MVERGLYYADNTFFELIRSVGGEWNDTKHRPMVCLIKSSECDDIYWAIPMGNCAHRSPDKLERIQRFIDLPDSDIRSCYYHIGRTTAKSIFFISDAVPITEKYISSTHTGFNGEHYVIKNPNLIAELERKLKRILSFENARPNSYRQHITDIKIYLMNECKESE